MSPSAQNADQFPGVTGHEASSATIRTRPSARRCSATSARPRLTTSSRGRSLGSATRSAGGRRVGFDESLRGVPGSRASASTRSGGRSAGSSRPAGRARADAIRLTVDATVQQRGAARARLRIASGARDRRLVRERRRDRGARPAERRGARARLQPDLQAEPLRRTTRLAQALPASPETVRRAQQLPRREPCRGRPLSAGLHVQARRGARRDARGAPLAVLTAPVQRRVHLPR